MEVQLAEERAKLRLEEAKKESRLRAEMEGTLELKDRQLQDIMERMRRLEENLHEAKKEVPGSNQIHVLDRKVAFWAVHNRRSLHAHSLGLLLHFLPYSACADKILAKMVG